MQLKYINYIFNSNPELKKIGTKLQYYKYLSSIFHNSKFKKIAFHHSDKKLEKFKDDFLEGYAAKHGVSKKAIFFLKKPIKRDFLKERHYLILVKLNLQKPFIYRNKFKTGTKKRKAHPGIKEGIDYALNNGYDSVVFKKIWDNRNWCDVVSVFSSKQIHVLGSKKDLMNFKKFLNKK
jgi:hypothetical protein